MNQKTPPQNLPILTVSQLNTEVRMLLESHYGDVVVQGEISNLATPASGHSYFSLKDEKAQIRCAFFRQQKLRCRHPAREGAQVLVRGRLSLYENRGDYQLIVQFLEDAGEGLLRQRFEQLKYRLNEEGLFAENQKKPMPEYPRRIGVITSTTGAAIRDVLSVLKRRYAIADVIVFPVSVQGDKAKTEIAEALAIADQQNCDVIILTRGGGSLEDLWPFNEEKVARAIFDCATPVVSGVGHETDFTITDLVADLRAPTPTAAAELVTPDSGEILSRILTIRARLMQHVRYRVNHTGQLLDMLISRLVHPQQRLNHLSQRLRHLAIRLQVAERLARQNNILVLKDLEQRLQTKHPSHRVHSISLRLQQIIRQFQQLQQFSLYRRQQQLQSLRLRLSSVSPQATLDRGYAILKKTANGQILRRKENAEKGEILSARISDGHLNLQVVDNDV